MLIKYSLILLQVLFIIRFHMELAKLNAFTEPVNTLRKITNPLVLPMKKLIPFIWAKKFAAIKTAYLIGAAFLFVFAPQTDWMNILLRAFLWLVRSWLLFLQYGIFIYVVGSWIRVPAMQNINSLLHYLFEPVLHPIRRVIPSLGGIDISPMILLFGLSFASRWFFGLFQ